MAPAAMLDFRALERRLTTFRSGNVKKIKEDNVMDHLKSRNGCSGGCTRGVFGSCTIKQKVLVIVKSCSGGI